MKAGYFELLAGRVKGMTAHSLVLNHTWCIEASQYTPRHAVIIDKRI